MNYQKTAQEFVNKIKSNFDIQLNIINAKGIIIASSQVNRIGDFHEIAYQMIQTHTEVTHNDQIDKNLTGVLTGINMLLKKNNKPTGVIGITGLSKDNEKMIQIIKYFFESLINYSVDTIIEPNSQLSELAHALFINKPVNYSQVLNLFTVLGLDANKLRLPILITSKTPEELTKLHYFLKNIYSQDSQNLILQMDSSSLLVFLRITYQDSLDALATEFYNNLHSISRTIDFQLFYSTPINDIRTYPLTYYHLLWLKNLTLLEPCKIKCILDYLDLLIISSQSYENYNHIFQYYKKILEEFDFLKEFIRYAGPLISNNMNNSKAAETLFVHKNTIVFHMNKVKSLLNISPYTNNNHMLLFKNLYYYILLDKNSITSFQKFYDKYNK